MYDKFAVNRISLPVSSNLLSPQPTSWNEYHIELSIVSFKQINLPLISIVNTSIYFSNRILSQLKWPTPIYARRQRVITQFNWCFQNQNNNVVTVMFQDCRIENCICVDDFLYLKKKKWLLQIEILARTTTGKKGCLSSEGSRKLFMPRFWKFLDLKSKFYF